MALPGLQQACGIIPAFDGTLSGLLEAMDGAGVERSVVQPVPTKPEHVAGINEWAATLTLASGGRVVGWGALHPDLDDPAAEVARLAAAGFTGFKLHPEFQVFSPDEPRLDSIHEAAAKHGMAIFYHAGFDIVMPTVRSSPEVFARVLDRHPRLTVVLGHMGGYRQWDDVERHLVGREVYLDTSFSLPLLGPERFVRLVRAHGPSRVVFGSDGPWSDVGREVEALSRLDLAPDELDAILFANAERLLDGGGRRV